MIFGMVVSISLVWRVKLSFAINKSRFQPELLKILVELVKILVKYGSKNVVVKVRIQSRERFRGNIRNSLV